MNSSLKLFLIGIISLSVLTLFSLPVRAIKIEGGEELGLRGPSEDIVGVPKPTGPGGLISVIVQIINYGLYIIGTIAVAFIIWGGFVYITSAGNDEGIKKAKTIITYAIIGLIVAIVAWVIVNAVITEIFRPGGY